MSDPDSESAPHDNESESKADETAVQPEQQEHGPDDAAQHGRHELPPHQPTPDDRRAAAHADFSACCGAAGQSSARWR